MRQTLRVLAALAVLTAIGALAPSAEATRPGKNGLIAYGYESSDAETGSTATLALVKAARPKRRTLLIDCSASPTACLLDATVGPAFSPDGKRRRRLTDSACEPTISPDLRYFPCH